MLSTRAATRAYTLAGAAQRRAQRNDAAYYAAAARSLLALASSLLEPASPRLIAIGGVQGSAKAALTHGLAATFPPAPGARVLRAGVALRTILRLPLNARLPATDDDATIDAMYVQLGREAARVLDAGFTAIIDASFVRGAHRDAIAAVASAAAAPFVGLWLGPFRDLQAEGAIDTGAWHGLQANAVPASLLATARVLALADMR